VKIKENKMSNNETVLRFNPKQLSILNAIGVLILRREEEINNSKKTTINAYSISKETGFDFNTCKKYLKQLGDIK
jgi:hypothetical protein